MDNLSYMSGGNLNLVSAALAQATGNINLNIAVGTNGHVIDGQFFTRAANASQAWTVSLPPVFGQPTNGSFTGQDKPGSVAGATVNGSTRLYGLYMNAAGTLIVVPGPIVATSDLQLGLAPLQFTAPRRDAVCFGFVRIAVTLGTTFIPGVTAMNAAGVTTTFLNVATIPAEPLRA